MAAALQVLPCLARAPFRPLLWGRLGARLASGMALAEHARKLFEGTIAAVLPGPMMHRALSLDPGSGQLKVRDRSFQLRQNLYLVGFGKAVLGMAAAAEELLGNHLVQGVISVPKGIRAAMEYTGKQEMLLKSHSCVQVFEGAEDNLPDRDALRAALAIRQLAEGLTADDLLLVLISGGGSALLPAPIPPVTLEEKQTLTKLLAARGATIQELNTIRKALSQLKGGGLAQAAYPAQSQPTGAQTTWCGMNEGLGQAMNECSSSIGSLGTGETWPRPPSEVSCFRKSCRLPLIIPPHMASGEWQPCLFLLLVHTDVAPRP